MVGEPVAEWCPSTRRLTGEALFSEPIIGQIHLYWPLSIFYKNHCGVVFKHFNENKYFKYATSLFYLKSFYLILLYMKIGNILEDKSYYINEDNRVA